MLLLPHHPSPYFGLPSLSGNTLDDVMMTVACGNCEELVPIPSGLVKKHMKRVKSQKLRIRIDDYSFQSRKMMLDDKLELQRLDLEFMYEALKETRDLATYADLSEQYMKGQSRYLSLLEETVYMEKLKSEMIEASTIDCSDIVRGQIKTCDAYDKDLEDIRKTLDYLRKENENFKRNQVAAANLSKSLTHRFLEEDQHLSSERLSITTKRSLARNHRLGLDRHSEIRQLNGPDRYSISETLEIADRSSIAGAGTARSQSSLSNRLSRVNRCSSTYLETSMKNKPPEYSSSKDFPPPMKHSSSPENLSLSTESPSIENRATTGSHFLHANESPSSLSRELPTDLEIEDSELLFEP